MSATLSVLCIAGAPPLPQATGPGGCKLLQLWEQCGGQVCYADVAASQPGQRCSTVIPWQGYCCPAGAICRRHDAHFWQCRPAGPDQLLLSIPTAEVAGGSAARVVANLKQAGEAIPNEAVTFVLTDAATGAVAGALNALTDDAGVATLEVPARMTAGVLRVSATHSNGPAAPATQGVWVPDSAQTITWVQVGSAVHLLSSGSNSSSMPCSVASRAVTMG
jgi:hypothetical protein